ncbi:uncharacterized protein LOC143300607 [Babylonia areolata]|uniref:uncharacterized protein LOC143300607 n=1 Tax=Babylonia areolata TaxID=304850 RepID=UPI003FCFDC96
MDDSASTAFIDHKETLLTAPPPHQVNASKMDVASPEGRESGGLDSEAGISTQAAAQDSPVTAVENPPLENPDAARHSSPSLADSSDATPAEEVPAAAAATQESQDGESAVQETSGDEAILSETAETGRPEEEKEVSEYCPGLAIRSLALEDILDRTVPVPGSPNEDTTSGFQPAASSAPSSELATSETMSQSAASSPAGSCSSTHAGQTPLSPSQQPLVAPHKKPLFDPIEVERKFTIAADTEERLRSLGGKLHREKTFTDVYYDNDQYSLILSDCWLRRRNDTWEAKVPLSSSSSSSQDSSSHTLFAPSTQYREISGEREVSHWLVERLMLDPWMRGDPVELLARAAGLSEFARFTTVRRSYTLPSCVVDLDLTDHGFRVGEIEVMAGSPEELPRALQTISGVAHQLGLTPLILA